MIDLKILLIRDILVIQSVEYAKNFSPLSLIIQGEHFDQATQVLVNDIAAPEFIVLSPSRLMAQVPTSERSSVLSKLQVLADKPSMNRSSLLSFDVGGSIKGIKGIERLVQVFIKLILQTPGSDKFNPSEGGGLLSVIGRNISRSDTKGVQATIVGAVGRARDQILAKQGRNHRIPSDERLLSAITEAVGYDPSTTTVSARVALAAVSGRTAVANLTF